MGGAHALAVEHEHARCERVVERLRRRDLRDLRRPQLAGARDREHELARRRGQRRHPRAQQLIDRLRQRYVLADLEGAVREERAPQLEREQRVAERRLDDAPEDVPRETEAEPLGEQPLRRPRAERCDLEAAPVPATPVSSTAPPATVASAELGPVEM